MYMEEICKNKNKQGRVKNKMQQSYFERYLKITIKKKENKMRNETVTSFR